MRFYEIYDGDNEIEVVTKGFREICCDCGAVHVLDFRIDGKRLFMKVRRDERSTKSHRRNQIRHLADVTLEALREQQAARVKSKQAKRRKAAARKRKAK